MAHTGFIAQNVEWPIELILVPSNERPTAFGSFAFSLDDNELLRKVDAFLSQYLGTEAHRKMVRKFGFSDQEIDLVAAFEG